MKIGEIVAYLEQHGWFRQPECWRGASIWSHDGGEVLVPARDGMGDGELRVRQIVETLALVEERPFDAVAQDITDPADVVEVRTCPDAPSGHNLLRSALRELNSLTASLVGTARMLDEGPHVAFRGRISSRVRGVVDRVQVGAARPGSYVLPVRVPVDDFARRVVVGLHEALCAVRGAVGVGEMSAFDATVCAGVSADLCHSLQGFAGENLVRPFGFGFRWADTLPAAAVGFPEGAGQVLREAAGYLRHAKEFGEMTVTGLVDRLHNGSWRVQVRGDERAMWVRLADLTAYDAALAARQEGHRVRATGMLSRSGVRIELLVGRNDFEVLG